MTEIACFVSSKGGSGKTVTCSSLGTFLSELGFRVLLIDTDAATNGMTLLFLEQLLGRRNEINARDTSGSVLCGLFEAEGGSPSQIEIDSHLSFVPAAFTIVDTESTSLERFQQSLSETITAGHEFDFILIDAQAGADHFARIAAKFSDQKVIVSEYDPVSAQGIDRLKLLLGADLDPASTWTLFNKILPEFATAIGDGLSIARYLYPVPWDADVVRAFARRDLAIQMSEPNTYTLAISRMAYQLFPDSTGDNIAEWRDNALAFVKDPAAARLAEIKDGIQWLQYRLRKNDRRSATLQTIALLTSVAFAVFSVFWVRDLDAIRHTFSVRVLGVLPGDALAIAIPLIATLVVVAAAAMRFLPSRAPDYGATLALLNEERNKLSAMIEGAEAALRFDRSQGIYERRRRSGSSSQFGT